MKRDKILSLQFQRDDLISRIAVLRSRHRKRKALQKILVQLTTAQIKAQNALDRR